MPREKAQPKPKVEQCNGGRSYGCRREPHDYGRIRDVLCYRCGSRMGCSACVERPREMLCLACHNWASRLGVEHHGNIVPNSKIQRVRTDRGVVTWAPGRADPLGEVAEMVRNPPF
jgi:hypothetical protein